MVYGDWGQTAGLIRTKPLSNLSSTRIAQELSYCGHHHQQYLSGQHQRDLSRQRPQLQASSSFKIDLTHGVNNLTVTAVKYSATTRESTHLQDGPNQGTCWECSSEGFCDYSACRCQWKSKCWWCLESLMTYGLDRGPLLNRRLQMPQSTLRPRNEYFDELTYGPTL